MTKNTAEPTKAELVAAFWRSRLPTIGLSFKQAMDIPNVAWALKRSAIAHRTAPAPAQAPLFEEMPA